MSNLGEIRALLIEPHSGMRVSLHNMLNLCGISKIDHAISAGTGDTRDSIERYST